MQNEKKLVRGNNYRFILFVCIYFCMFLKYFINDTVFVNFVPDNIFNYLRIPAILFLLLKLIIFDRFKLNEVLLYCFLAIVFLLSTYKSGTALLIDLFIVMLSAKNIDKKKIIKLSFTVLSISLLLIICLSLLDIIPNLYYSRINSSGVMVIRNSFGTTYPTILGSFTFFWSLQWVYLRKYVGYSDAILLVFIAFLIQKFTDNRLVFSMIIILALYCLTERILRIDFSKFSKTFSNIWISLIVLAPISFIFICYKYKSSNVVLVQLNDMLTSRLSLSRKGMDLYSFSLFGTKIQQNGSGNWRQFDLNTEYFYLDSLPVYLLLACGILICALYIIYNVTFIKRCFLNKENKMIIILTLIVIYDIVDNKSLRIAYNPFILIYFGEIFGFNTVNKKNKRMQI